MKCQSCGGPVEETAGRGRMICSYCGTIQIQQRSATSVDRVSLLDQPGEYDCPSCEVQLTKAFVDDVLIESCPSCQGVLFHREVFTEIVWNRRSAYQGADETPIPVNTAELKERRPCPKCHQNMDCHAYYGPGNTVIDSCDRCNLVWLDVGELLTIERAAGQRQLHR